MKPVVKLILVTLPLVAIGVGVLAYVVVNSPPPERAVLAERITQVRAIVARNQEITPKVVAFGLVTPARIYEAIAQVAGTVEYVNPDLRKGTILPAGSILIRLASSDFNLAIAQANANIRAAEARLAELTVSEANQGAALSIEQESLAIKVADLERTETLLQRGTIPQTARDTARAALLAQRQKVQAIDSTLALLPTQRDVQTEQIAVYRTNLETAKLNLARTELSLPFAARVASTSIEVGQFVSSGKPVAVLDGIDAAEVEAQVPVTELRALIRSTESNNTSITIEASRITKMLQSIGLRSEVHLRLGGDIITWPAKVDRISDTIDPRSGTIGIIVRIDTAYSTTEPGNRPPLTKGMFVDVSLEAKPSEGIVVPRSALRNGQLLIADENDRLVLKTVTFELMQDEIALIKDGVDQGARIIVSTPNSVVEGMLLGVTLDEDLMDIMDVSGSTK